MMSAREKAAYGLLGTPPPEIASCKRLTVQAWKTLAEQAKAAAKLPAGPVRSNKMRTIAYHRQALVSQIINEAKAESAGQATALP